MIIIKNIFILEVILEVIKIRNIKLRIMASRASSAMRRWWRWVIMERIAVEIQNGIKAVGINVRVIVLGDILYFWFTRPRLNKLASNTVVLYRFVLAFSILFVYKVKLLNKKDKDQDSN